MFNILAEQGRSLIFFSKSICRGKFIGKEIITDQNAVLCLKKGDEREVEDLHKIIIYSKYKRSLIVDLRVDVFRK